MQKYENATNRIAASRLHQIALALGVEAAWFYEGLPTTRGGQEAGRPAGPTGTRQSIELLRHFDALDEVLRRQIFTLVKVLAKAPDSAAPALQIEGAHGAPLQADGGAGFAPGTGVAEDE